MTAGLTQERRRPSPLALAAAVFGDQARLGCVEIRAAEMSGLHALEAARVEKAVPSRQREFAAGRQAARIAMAADLAIPMATDRAPIWPAGISGSITHAGGWALAVVSGSDRLIGIDLEVDEPLPMAVFETVLTPAERDWIRLQPDPAHWARVIFCVKECAYKAQYPRSGQLFGFEMFETALDVKSGAFTATFQATAAPFDKGDRLWGRFSRRDGFVLSGVLM